MWNWDGMPPAATVPKHGYRFSEAEHRRAAEHVRDNYPEFFEWVCQQAYDLPQEPDMQMALHNALKEMLPGYLGFDQIYAFHMVKTLANPPSTEEINRVEASKMKYNEWWLRDPGKS